jgi:hypothetical protein
MHALESYQRVGPDGGKARGQGTGKIAHLLRDVKRESNMTLSTPAAAVLFLTLGLLKQGTGRQLPLQGCRTPKTGSMLHRPAHLRASCGQHSETVVRQAQRAAMRRATRAHANKRTSSASFAHLVRARTRMVTAGPVKVGGPSVASTPARPEIRARTHSPRRARWAHCARRAWSAHAHRTRTPASGHTLTANAPSRAWRSPPNPAPHAGARGRSGNRR